MDAMFMIGITLGVILGMIYGELRVKLISMEYEEEITQILEEKDIYN